LAARGEEAGVELEQGFHGAPPGFDASIFVFTNPIKKHNNVAKTIQ